MTKQELINKIEAKATNDSFEGWEKEIEKEGYAIAGDFFGHGDDCFEAGQEYGQILYAQGILNLLKGMED